MKIGSSSSSRYGNPTSDPNHSKNAGNQLEQPLLNSSLTADALSVVLPRESLDLNFAAGPLAAIPSPHHTREG